jgi:hypothetical protein
VKIKNLTKISPFGGVHSPLVKIGFIIVEVRGSKVLDGA